MCRITAGHSTGTPPEQPSAGRLTLFRRRAPLHRQLADAGGLDLGLGSEPARPFDDGEPREPDAVSHRPEPASYRDDARPLPGEWPGGDGFGGDAHGGAGVHGVSRPRRWDTVSSAQAPGLRGDEVHFIALPDGTLVVSEDEPDEALGPLADAVERSLGPPYRAEAVRRSGPDWAVAARRVSIVELRGLSGDEVELAVTRDGRSLDVDGKTTLGRSPELERIGEGHSTEYVVRASRVDGDLWEVEASPL